MNPRMLRAAACAALLTTLAACAPQEAPTAADLPGATGQTRRVERLRLAGGDFGYPSPFAYVRGPGMIHASYMFDTLLWRDSTGEPIPWLAREWETSPDGTEWRFTLGENVKWHDGQPLTAEDVAFTFDYMTQGPGKDANVIHARGLGKVVQDVVAEGPNEVLFRLQRPVATFQEDVAGLWGMMIIPEHIWSEVTDPVRFRDPKALIGSGPYRLESLDEAAGSYLYTANDDFFLGPPVVQRLEFVPAQDPLRAVERGEISAGGPELETGVPQAQVEALEGQFTLLEAPGEWNLALHFNLAKGFPYDDPRFRQAIAYALDREDLVDRLLLGRGQPGSPGGLAPAHPMLAEDLPSYRADLGKASALLDELGLNDTDGDGIRQLRDGSPLRQSILASARFSPKSVELISEQLRAVGIEVQPDLRDRATADAAAGAGDHTMALIGYGGLMSDPDFLRTRYSSQVDSQSFAEAHGYANPRFDQLAVDQLVTLDCARREAIVEQMQQILAEDVPVLSLYVPDQLTFYDESTFDAWYYTPGCAPCGATRNKHMFVTGKKQGL